MTRNDKSIPIRTQKKIFQEANSSCSFCHERKIELLEIHHITPRSQNGSNQASNLILVCRNCHAEIENNILNEAEVLKTKKLLTQNVHQLPKRSSNSELNITGNIQNSYIGNTININSKKKSNSGSKSYPIGSIGADLEKGNYIKYLVKQYFDFRKADKSFGRQREFNYGVLHKNIENKFKAKTYFIKLEKFEEVVIYLQNRIDKTILAKKNRRQGKNSYSSFGEYLKKYS